MNMSACMYVYMYYMYSVCIILGTGDFADLYSQLRWIVVVMLGYF